MEKVSRKTRRTMLLGWIDSRKGRVGPLLQMVLVQVIDPRRGNEFFFARLAFSIRKRMQLVATDEFFLLQRRVLTPPFGTRSFWQLFV